MKVATEAGGFRHLDRSVLLGLTFDFRTPCRSAGDFELFLRSIELALNFIESDNQLARSAWRRAIDVNVASP